MTLKVLDLFSGIGGFSLGLERTGGFKTIAFCEIDNYCQRVLHKHWPNVYIHSDIRTLTARNFDGYERPDVITGGFPCQPFSHAGRKRGKGDDRFLWPEMLRVIRDVRPKYILGENVPGLLSIDDGRIIEGIYADLEAEGYKLSPPIVFPALAIRARHRRDRVWIVGHSDGVRPRIPKDGQGHTQRNNGDAPRQDEVCQSSGSSGSGAVYVADSSSLGSAGQRVPENPGYPTQDREGKAGQSLDVRIGNQWAVEPNVGRVANGIPNRMDRLRGLGNAVVPQIAEWIGYRILEANNDV